jgi:hypothetical protein
MSGPPNGTFLEAYPIPAYAATFYLPRAHARQAAGCGARWATVLSGSVPREIPFSNA